MAPNPLGPLGGRIYFRLEDAEGSAMAVMGKAGAAVRIRIYTTAQARIFQAEVDGAALLGGWNHVAWDGRDLRGDSLHGGLYFCEVAYLFNGQSQQRLIRSVVLLP